MVCLFSSLLLWTSMACAYCVAIMLVCLHVLFVFVTGCFILVSKFFIDRICEVALAPASKTMTRAIFHPLIAMLFMSDWYLVVFLSRASMSNLSL
jgi:hypothetical protein